MCYTSKFEYVTSYLDHDDLKSEGAIPPLPHVKCQIQSFNFSFWMTRLFTADWVPAHALLLYSNFVKSGRGGGQFCSVKVTKFKHLLMGSVIWYSRFTRWCNLIPSKNLNFENTYKSFSFLILSYLNFVFCRESDHSVGFYIIYIYLSAYSSKSIISFLYLLICLSVDLSIGLAVYLLICIFV